MVMMWCGWNRNSCKCYFTDYECVSVCVSFSVYGIFLSMPHHTLHCVHEQEHSRATEMMEMGYKRDGLSMCICMVNGTHCCSAFLTIEWQQFFVVVLLVQKGMRWASELMPYGTVWKFRCILLVLYPVNMPTREHKMHCESEFLSFCSPFFTRWSTLGALKSTLTIRIDLPAVI